jgi:hypothetical protein
VTAGLDEGELTTAVGTGEACETGLQAVSKAKIADINMNFHSLLKASSQFIGC